LTSKMNLHNFTVTIFESLLPLAVPVTIRAKGMDTPRTVDTGSLQKKASEAQARIRASKDDRDALMRAIKINEVPLAKEVLLRNGFTAQDLENAKITLRTGGGKKGEHEIEISSS